LPLYEAGTPRSLDVGECQGEHPMTSIRKMEVMDTIELEKSLEALK
jgi:hypothetical protein